MGQGLTGIDEAVAAVRRGGLVVIPTETVYGLAADAARPHAVARIFELKGRESSKALQVLVPGAEWLEEWAQPGTEARALAAAFWPGPLTLVVRAGPRAPAAVVSDGTIGLRVPGHPSALEVLRRTGPLAASSANRSGEATPPDVEAIVGLFGSDVDAYVDGGRIEGPASTVVDVSSGVPVVAREGAVSGAEIERALGGRFEAG